MPPLSVARFDGGASFVEFRDRALWPREAGQPRTLRAQKADRRVLCAHAAISCRHCAVQMAQAISKENYEGDALYGAECHDSLFKHHAPTYHALLQSLGYGVVGNLTRRRQPRERGALVSPS